MRTLILALFLSANASGFAYAQTLEDDAREALDATGNALEKIGDAAGRAGREGLREVERKAGEAAGALRESDLGRDLLRRPTVSRAGYGAVELDEVSRDALVGARVYTVRNEDVGEVGRVVRDPSGAATGLVIDVGGFLGIGEREVALSRSEVAVMRESTSGDLRVFVDATRAEIEAMPLYAD